MWRDISNNKSQSFWLLGEVKSSVNGLLFIQIHRWISQQVRRCSDGGLLRHGKRQLATPGSKEQARPGTSLAAFLGGLSIFEHSTGFRHFRKMRNLHRRGYVFLIPLYWLAVCFDLSSGDGSTVQSLKSSAAQLCWSPKSRRQTICLDLT